MIKVSDIAYVRFAVPDLATMDTFAKDFGFVPAERNERALYSRGTDPSPYIHIAELDTKGEAGFRGVAFEAASAEDLKAAAQLEGASAVSKIEAPGGGVRIGFTDPDGFKVEVVHGRELLPELEVRKPSPLNRGSDRQRFGELQRLEAGPAQVKRLGHCVLAVSNFESSRRWYTEHFGFLTSDEVYLGDPNNLVTAFLRCDRGDEHVDHHTLLCVGIGEPGFDHAAFEVEDFDSLMLGHDHLKKAGYDHHAGIGRHILGAQIFDYWKDPWGHVHEHFSDGDLLNAASPAGSHDPASALGTQWGSFMAGG
jgi:catechol 2,3-dioxygenase-like lactoylglutathione lyase family enzyme